MSAYRPLTVCVQVLLAVAMTLPLLAGTVQAGPFITPAQQTQIEAASPAGYGPGAPFGSWSKMKETQTFYIHSNHAGGGGGYGNPDAPGSISGLGYDQLLPILAADTEEYALGGNGYAAGPYAAAPFYATFPGNNPTFGACQTLAPAVLDETALFHFKINFYASYGGQEDEQMRVYFFDLGPTCAIANNGQPIALVLATGGTQSTITGAQNANACDAYVRSGCLSTSNAGLFSGEVDVCGNLGGNQITPACSTTYGYPLAQGHRLGFQIHAYSNDLASPPFTTGFAPPDDAGNLILAFDSLPDAPNFLDGYPSNFQVTAESARVNMWNQDRFGTVTTTYPTASINGIPTNALDRTLHWNAIQFDTWGHNCPMSQQPNLVRFQNSCNAANGQTQLNFIDGIAEESTAWRIRDMTATHTGAGYCGPDGTFCYGRFLAMDLTLGLSGFDPGQDRLKLQCCNYYNKPIEEVDSGANGDGVLGLQRYQYELTYPPEFKDGTYQIEFQDEIHGWNTPIQFSVGGSGFEFKFHDDEPLVDPTGPTADHLVALEESTKYSMLLTNNGVTTDTFSLAVPVPGQGWIATVSPHQVTLPPKGFANVDVIVTPPPTAHAGDIKVVSVTATDPQSNQVKTLYTRTTYTAQQLHGVRVTTPAGLIEMRPGLSKVLGAVVHNNGTVQDEYVLTASGQPDGWSVGISPTFLNVLAASREDVSVNVLADAAAPPGSSFTLNLKACKNTDASVCGSVDIPITVYMVHGVDVSVLPELDPQCATALGRAGIQTSEQNPADLIPCATIAMRDAEWDNVVVTPAGCAGPFVPTPGVTCSTTTIRNRDTKFDDGSIFRVKVENTGDSEDAIAITTAWDPTGQAAPLGSQYHRTQDVKDANDCDGTNDIGYNNGGGDGVPDGWRFRILGGAAGTNPFGASLEGMAADPGMVYGEPTSPTPPARIDFNGPESVLWGWGNTAAPQRGVAGVRGDGTGFSGEHSIGTVTLPAHAAQYVYVELFWRTPLPGMDGNDDYNTGDGSVDGCTAAGYEASGNQFDPCGGEGPTTGPRCNNFRVRMPSPNAYLRFSYRSLDESSIHGRFLLHAALDGNSRTSTVNPDGNDPTAANLHHTVLLERGIGQPDEEYVPIGTATPYATFDMMATNTGNEYDNLKIDVDDGHNGWMHTFPFLPGAPAGSGTGIVPTGAGLLQPTPVTYPSCGQCVARPDRTCTFSDAAQQHLVCKTMGIFDAVNFQARCIPPTFAQVGDYDDMTIEVSSDRANELNGVNIISRTTVRCTAQGNYAFELENPNHDLIAYPTQTIAFPFSLRNIGLANDRYEIRVDAHVKSDGTTANPTNDPWNPKTSSGLVAAVPAGFWYHGFLSVTVPADAQITDDAITGDVTPDEHFRLIIKSLDSSAQESKVLDFTAIVTDIPKFTVTADPVTIAGGTSDAVKIHAIDCSPDTVDPVDCQATGLTSVSFNGYYLSESRGLPPLPRDFAFTCLPGDTDGDGFEDSYEVRNFAATAWQDNTVPPTGTPGPKVTQHPHFDKYRGCYRSALGAIPGPALSPNCYPVTPDPTLPPCGSFEWKVQPTFAPSADATQQLEVSVPPDQLGISRVA
ncbi:MAG: hypothetical protein ABR562_00130, partial [Thermoplasmatota archaeon]